MNELIGSTRECISKGLRGAPKDVFVALRNLDSVAKTPRRYRSKLINSGEIMYEILGLGSSLTKTISGETFYQFGPDNNRDIETNINFCLFYSRTKMDLLKEAPILCVDETFSVVPPPYYQLFTISIIRGVHVNPVVYALLPKKGLATYLEVYRVLQQLEGVFVPVAVKTDFEIASIMVLMSSFPGIMISGCQFHLGQNSN